MDDIYAIHATSPTTSFKLFCCSYTLRDWHRPHTWLWRENLVAVEQRCKQRDVMVELEWMSYMKMNAHKVRHAE